MTGPQPASPANLDLLHALGIDRPSRWRRWLKRVAWMALAAAVAALAARKLVERARPAQVAYDTRPAERRDVTGTVTASGTLEPWTTVEIGPEISGRVRAVHADFNDRVTRGQILVELDTDLLAAQVAQADSQVASAAAALAQARVTRAESTRTLARSSDLARQGLVAVAEVDAARAAAERAEGALTAAAAQLRAARAAALVARTSLGKTTIRSPIDGVVLSRSVDVGQTVVAMLQAPVLFRLAEDLRRMRLLVDVDEADIGHVRAGQRASFTVAAYPSRTFRATVTSVRNAALVRENVVNYQAVLDVDNPDGLLRPGMTGTAQIVADVQKNALTVPAAALRYRPRGSAADEPARPRVWVLRNREPHEVAVTPGLSDEVHTAVTTTGLAAGDPVIVGEREAPR